MDNQSSTPKNPKFDFKSADIGVKTATSPTFGTVTPDRPGFGARLKSFFSRIGAFFHKIGVKLKVYIFRPLFSGWRKFVTLGILALLIAGTACGIFFLSRRQTPAPDPNLTIDQKISENAAVIEKIYQEGKPGYKDEMLHQINHAIDSTEKKNLYKEGTEYRWQYSGILFKKGMKSEALDIIRGFNADKVDKNQRLNVYYRIFEYAKDLGLDSLADDYWKKN